MVRRASSAHVIPAVSEDSQTQNIPNRQPRRRSRIKAAETEEQRQLRYMEQHLDGDKSYHDKMFGNYYSNLLRHTKRDTRTAYMICAGVESSLEIEQIGDRKVTFPVKKPQKDTEKKKNVYQRMDVDRKKVHPTDWKTLQDYFASQSGAVEMEAKDPTFRNLMRLADILHLNDVEKESLKVLYSMDTYGIFGELVRETFNDDLKMASVAMARMMDRPADAPKIFNTLHFGSRLANYGLINSNDDFYDDDGKPLLKSGKVPEIDADLLSCLERADMTEDEIVSVLLGKQRKSELKLSDFDYLGEQLDHLVTLVKNAVDQGKKGINVLLYGPAGSGKTELATVLAQELGFRLYTVGEENDEDVVFSPNVNNGDSTGKKRMAHLSRSQALLRESRNSVLFFDEIEDLLIKGGDSEKKADTESKIGVNRMLEENPVLVIWTGNDPDKFHTAVRQRMAYSVFMDYPPTLVRKRIWERRLELANCTLPDEHVHNLARRYAAPPRMISMGVQTSLATMKGGLDQVEESLRAASKLGFDQVDATLIEDPVPAGFGIDWVNAEGNLPEVFNCLVKAGKDKKPFTLLVQDKPGLGGEDLLRLMAEEMCMNPLEYHVADLVAPHPMMPPEAKVKMAFAGAVDGRQFLILKGLEDVADNPKSPSSTQWGEPIVHTLVKEALMHRLPLAMSVNEKVKLPAHVRMIFSNVVKMLPIAQTQGESLYKKLFGEDAPELLRPILAKTVTEDLFRLKSISRKFIDGIDHDRMAALLMQMQDARSMKGAGLGFAV